MSFADHQEFAGEVESERQAVQDVEWIDLRETHRRYHDLVVALAALEAELRDQQERHGRATARGQLYGVVADRLEVLLSGA